MFSSSLRYSIRILNSLSLPLTALTLDNQTLVLDELYYEYVPDGLQWHSAVQLCIQRSGALAAVSDPEENRELIGFFKSSNISQPVWIARKDTTHVKSRFNAPCLSHIRTIFFFFFFKQ